MIAVLLLYSFCLLLSRTVPVSKSCGACGARVAMGLRAGAACFPDQSQRLRDSIILAVGVQAGIRIRLGGHTAADPYIARIARPKRHYLDHRRDDYTLSGCQ